MKFMLLCLLLPIMVTGQESNGFYLTHYGGYGGSNIRGGNVQGAKSVSAFKVGIGLSYHYKRVVVNSGLYYMTTGDHQKSTEVISVYNGAGYDITQNHYDELYSYGHLLIPVEIGMSFPLHGRFSIIPMVGVAVGYNLGEYVQSSLASQSQSGAVNYYSFNSTTDDYEFDRKFHRMGVWGTLRVNAAYRIGKHLAVQVGPSYQYMISSITKRPVGSYTDLSQYRYHYTYLFDVSIQYRFW